MSCESNPERAKLGIWAHIIMEVIIRGFFLMESLNCAERQSIFARQAHQNIKQSCRGGSGLASWRIVILLVP